MQILWIFWLVKSLIDRYNDFYSYLYGSDHIPYEKEYLRVGQIVSRMSKRDPFNLYGAIRCQHFGVVIDIDDAPMIIHIISGKDVHVSSLKEYMDGESVLHTYHHNPFPSIAGLEGTKYSFLTSNCEHLATRIVDGVARSRQLEVMSHLYMNNGVPPPPEEMRLVPTVSLYIPSLYE